MFLKEKSLLCLGGFIFFLFSTQEISATEKIHPKMIIQATAENALQPSAARDFTLDDDHNIYIFHYMSNRIETYNPAGELLLSFGSQGDKKDQFKHLTAIKIIGNRLWALDSVAYLEFTLDGELLRRYPFAGEILCELPVISQDRTFVGEQNNAVSMQKILTLRNLQGVEQNCLTWYDLKGFFPRLKQGEDFFLQDQYARGYLYDFLPDGTVVWAETDSYRIHLFDGKQSTVLLQEVVTPVPFPDADQKRMKKQDEQLRQSMPSLHMFIPTHYPVIYELFTGEEDIWLYIKTTSREGLVRYSRKGREIGFYHLDADLDLQKTRIKIVDGKMYLLESRRKSFNFYSAEVPKVSVNLQN